MSKYDKTRAKILTKPSSADLKWDDLKNYLEHLGYETLNGSGSRRKFFHKEMNALIICHKPHPSPCVDKGCVADIAEHLKMKGFI